MLVSVIRVVLWQMDCSDDKRYGSVIETCEEFCPEVKKISCLGVGNCFFGVHLT